LFMYINRQPYRSNYNVAIDYFISVESYALHKLSPFTNGNGTRHQNFSLFV